MTDFDSSRPEAHFARGRLLQSQHRYADAVQSYKHALSQDPQHADSYVMLALCWLNMTDTEAPLALDAARRAVALEPQDAFFRSVLALAMNATAKDGQTDAIRAALEEAKAATGLDPDHDFSHAVQASLHLRLRQLPEAEAAARKSLELDTENTMAAGVLSAALLMQRKDGDNRSLIEYQLQRNPDDDDAHTSAGWQALMEGDHKRANQHFMEALRLSPMNESARMGLVESYRARSVLYRAQLRFAHFMNQFTEGRQTAIMVGGFVAYKVLSASLKNVSPLLSGAVIGVWLVFALWSHLARSFGSFFILFDRFARQALRPREFWEGAVVGGLIVAALASLAAMAFTSVDGTFPALAFLLAAVANAAAFTNSHHLGRHIYAVAGTIAGFGALYAGLATFFVPGLPSADLFGALAILTGVLVSWLRPFRFLYS